MERDEGRALRRLRWVACAMSVAIAASGCGGGGGGGDAGTTPPPPPPPPPPPSGFSVAGSVSGLAAGSTVTLSSGTRSVTASANGPFTLGTDFTAGSSYDIRARPSARESRCTVNGGRGTVAANVTGVGVDCSLGMAWVADGTVLAHALSADGRTLYVGGEFSRIGAPTGSLLRLDTTSGAPLAVPTLVVSDILNAAADGSGGAYVTLKSRQPRAPEADLLSYSVRRIDAQGAFTAFSPTGLNTPTVPNRAVPNAYQRLGDTLFVGGAFTLVGSNTTQGLAALNPDTGALLSWRSTLSGDVQALAAYGNTLFVARRVVENGLTRTTLGAVDALTGAARSWAPVFGVNFGSELDVRIAVSGSSLIVAGPFVSVDGVPRQRLAALSTASGQALAWQAPGVGSPFSWDSMAVQGDMLVLAGGFSSLGGQPRDGLAALSANTGELLNFAAGKEVPYPARVLSSGSQLWVSGSFALVGGVRRTGIAAIDTQTGRATDWTLPLAVEGPQASVRHMVRLGNRLVIAGRFDTVAGVARRDVAAVDLSTGQVLPWDAQFSASTDIRQLLAQGSSLYVVGAFQAWAGQPRAGLARFDEATLGLQAYNLAMGAAPFVPTRVAVTTDRVFVGGAAEGAAAFDAQTGARLVWAPQVNAAFGPPEVRDMAVLGSSVYLVGRNFARPEGLLSAVRVDAASGATTGWPAALDTFSRIFVVDGRPLLTRCATDIFGMKSCTLSERTPDTGADLGTLLTVDDEIEAVTGDALSLYLAGRFGLDGVSRQGVWFLSR